MSSRRTRPPDQAIDLWRRVAVGVAVAVVIAVVVVAGAVAFWPPDPPEVGHVNPCRSEGDVLETATEAFRYRTGRAPTGVDELTRAVIDGRRIGPMLRHRPTYWDLAPKASRMVVVPRAGMDLPPDCAGPPL